MAAAVDRAAALRRAGGPRTVVMATVAYRFDAPDPLMVMTDKGPAPNGYGP